MLSSQIKTAPKIEVKIEVTNKSLSTGMRKIMSKMTIQISQQLNPPLFIPIASKCSTLLLKSMFSTCIFFMLSLFIACFNLNSSISLVVPRSDFSTSLESS